MLRFARGEIQSRIPGMCVIKMWCSWSLKNNSFTVIHSFLVQLCSASWHKCTKCTVSLTVQLQNNDAAQLFYAFSREIHFEHCKIKAWVTSRHYLCINKVQFLKRTFSDFWVHLLRIQRPWKLNCASSVMAHLVLKMNELTVEKSSNCKDAVCKWMNASASLYLSCSIAKTRNEPLFISHLHNVQQVSQIIQERNLLWCWWWKNNSFSTFVDWHFFQGNKT